MNKLSKHQSRKVLNGEIDDSISISYEQWLINYENFLNNIGQYQFIYSYFITNE